MGFLPQCITNAYGVHTFFVSAAGYTDRQSLCQGACILSFGHQVATNVAAKDSVQDWSYCQNISSEICYSQSSGWREDVQWGRSWNKAFSRNKKKSWREHICFTFLQSNHWRSHKKLLQKVLSFLEVKNNDSSPQLASQFLKYCCFDHNSWVSVKRECCGNHSLCQGVFG